MEGTNFKAMNMKHDNNETADSVPVTSNMTFIFIVSELCDKKIR